MSPDVTKKDLRITWVADKPVAVPSPLFRKFNSLIAQGIMMELDTYAFDVSSSSWPPSGLLPFRYCFQLDGMPEAASRRSIEASCRLFQLHEPPVWQSLVDSYFPATRQAYLKWLAWTSALRTPDTILGLYDFVLVNNRLISGLPTTEALVIQIMDELDIHVFSGKCDWTTTDTYARNQYTLVFEAPDRRVRLYRKLAADLLNTFNLKGHWIHPKPREGRCQ